MKKIILILTLCVAFGISAWSQSTGTIELRDGQKLSGTITKYSPQNGYSYTFYRVDNENGTYYVSEADVQSYDTKRFATTPSKKGKKGIGKIFGAIGVAMTGAIGIGAMIGKKLHNKSAKAKEEKETITQPKSKKAKKALIFGE